MDKVLIFKLWGDYAHFKKYYTTTSPLTFEFPPPPTVIGIISAIIGLDKNEYLGYFQNPDEFKLTLSLNAPVKKIRWTQNLIDTKHSFWKIHNRTQIRIEFLKDPVFTIYFWHANKAVYETLKEHLRKHKSVYSIALGLSELLANYQFIEESAILQKENDDFIEVKSVLPLESITENGIDFESGKEIFDVNYPLFMNEERVVEKRDSVLFERNGNTISCKPKNYWQVESGEKIVFF
jgi:CRISPR-associated protein Cas5h